jgi:hypothetical protein
MRPALALLLTLAATPALAEGCRIQTAGSRCVSVPQAQRYVTPYAAGDTLPNGDFPMLFNATLCGLPPAQDGWRYLRIERDVMRVDMATLTVLAVVTEDLAPSCR